MKKFILPALLMVVATAFIACGNSNSNKNNQCSGYAGTTTVTSPQIMITLLQAYGPQAFAYPQNIAYAQTAPSYACVYTQAYNSVMGINGGSNNQCQYAFQFSDGTKECCPTNNPSSSQCYLIY